MFKGSMIFAPNPTGILHVGSALVYWLTWREARARGCRVVVHICGDKQHFDTPDGGLGMAEMVNILDAPYDEMFWTSDRMGRYYEVIHQFMETGAAKLEIMHPAKIILYGDPIAEDVCWGTIREKKALLWSQDSFNQSYVDGTLCSAVDFIDFTTPMHIRSIVNSISIPCETAIMRALDYDPPLYAHIPACIDKQYKKLSKSNSCGPQYEFSHWAQRFGSPKIVRAALEQLVFRNDGPKTWENMWPAAKTQI